MQEVYIGLGSNLGDRLENLKHACDQLAHQMVLLRVSKIYETAPWGVVDQPAFLNQVVETQTDIDPLQLLILLKNIEKEMGRLPSIRYGPRLIDLDILFFGQDIVDVPGLVIPHPALRDRAFVLVPLGELIPDFRHPVTGQRVDEMLGKVNQQGIKLFEGK